MLKLFKMPVEQLHAIDIGYPSGDAERKLHLISVKDFDGLEPVDFRELYPDDVAELCFKKIAHGATKFLLRERDKVFGESRPIKNMDRIASFLGKLSIQPFGKLSLVPNLELPIGRGGPVPIATPGITSIPHRQAFVIEDNVNRHMGEVYVASRLLPPISKELLIEEIAVHELVHLAGAPDLAYFVHTPASGNNPPDTVVRAAPTTLERGIDGVLPYGNFVEEGFAALCGHMYIWDKYPEIGKDTRAELKHAKGISVNMPVRHAYSASPYMYAALTVESLVGYSPNLWDILIASRSSETSPDEIRSAVRREIETIDEYLYDVIDSSNPHDLTQSMFAASLTGKTIRRESSRHYFGPEFEFRDTYEQL